MDVLQINWETFAIQVLGLVLWVFLAAAVYALVENYVDRHRGLRGRVGPADPHSRLDQDRR